MTGFDALQNDSGGGKGPGVLLESVLGGLGALVVLGFVFGLGVAIVYMLLVVVRWREERAHGRTGDEAVVRAMETAGRAVVFSGTTVAIEAIVRLTAGATIAEEIVDLNVSGGSMERERVHDAIERVERGDADGIVVAYLDRWARTVDALSIFRRWADEGRWFLSAAEKFDASTSQGRFAVGMMLLVAQSYREQLTERFASSQRHAIARGAFIGPTPFGYRRIEDPLSPRVGCLEPDPVTGPMVSEAYRRAACDGIAAAARYLGRSTSDTRRMLSNRVYLGEVRHATAGRNLNAHEPITDLGTWTAAQIKPRQRARSVVYPLSGIARCAGCGGPLTGQLSKDRQGSRGRRYRCSRRRSDSCVSIGADVLEAHACAMIVDALGVARPVVSPGARGLAKAEEALRDAEAILNAYAADTELQADLGMDAYRTGARQRREALQAAQRAAATRTRHDRYPHFVHRASAAVQHSTPPIRANPRACLAGRRACFPLEGEVRSRVPALAGRTGLDRQQAVGDLPIVRWRLLERAEPASTKRRLLLHLRLSGSLAAAREQVAASPHEHKRCRRRGPLSQCRRRAEERQPDSHPPRVSAPPCYCG